MSKLIDRPLTLEEYEQLARAYQKTLPLEHYMESLDQSMQRKIALDSLDLLHLRRPEVQVFSELLVQYPMGGEIHRVVPDNMVRLCADPPRSKGSFNLELEPVGPFWVLEWVSASSEGKDYGEAFQKYEQDLKVPYCLMFHPEDQDLRMYRHAGKRYKLIPANAAGRHPLPELELEVGLLDGWVRFWHRGELLELPADLVRRIDRLEKQAAEERRRAEEERRRAEEEKRRAEEEKQRRIAVEEEVARLRAQLTQGQPTPAKKKKKR